MTLFNSRYKLHSLGRALDLIHCRSCTPTPPAQTHLATADVPRQVANSVLPLFTCAAARAVIGLPAALPWGDVRPSVVCAAARQRQIPSASALSWRDRRVPDQAGGSYSQVGATLAAAPLRGLRRHALLCDTSLSCSVYHRLMAFEVLQPHVMFSGLFA